MGRPLSILLGLALLAAGAPAAEATFAGSNGRIVFAVSGTDVGQGGPDSTYEELRTVASNGKRDQSVEGCLRTGGEPEAGNCDLSYSAPVWSPDGRRLAFDAGDSLGLIDPDGSGLRLLDPVSSDDGEPAFSPSGRALAFTAKAGAQRNLHVISTAGSGVRRVVRDARSPDWSSRGRIAFARRGVLYSVRSGGKGLQRLTRGREPGWSASGRSIAFARRGGIYVARADGSRVRRLVRCSGCAMPAFSPNGKLLVYDDRGLRVVRVPDGRRVSTLVADVPRVFDGFEPDWQARRR